MKVYDAILINANVIRNAEINSKYDIFLVVCVITASVLFFNNRNYIIF